jgi:hypothetical protein
VLFWFAVCIAVIRSKKIKKNSSTATIVEIDQVKDESDWLDCAGVEVKRGKATLYKRVSKDFLTQEGTERETVWKPGTTITHPAWAPAEKECGGGKFHAVPAPYLADEFRSEKSDRYVAISVAVADLFAWKDSPQYPNKVAFRSGEVLYECDRYGKKIESKEAAA